MTEPPAAGRKPLRYAVYWCLYDWGNSAFPAVILSFVFAPYFLNQVATDAISGEAQWGFAISASALVIAVASPVLGALADQSGRRRPWLGLCSMVAILATAAMWTVVPGEGSIGRALILLVIANAAFELAYVFYNAMLPQVAPEDRIGSVSGFGWGAGYLGSVVSLGAVLFLFVSAEPGIFGITSEGGANIRAAALFTAAWFLVFTAPIILFGPPEAARGEPAAVLVRNGLRDLWRTVVSLRERPSIIWFLVAHMFYIDGVNTIFVFGPLVAVGLFGFAEDEILLYGVTIYLAAGFGAFAIGWIDDLVGAKRVVLGSLVGIVALAVALSFSTDKAAFWALSGALAVLFGPVQSSSRSLLVRLSPEEQRTKLFGLYALAGRAIAPFGPAMVSWVILSTGSQRAGILVVAAFLLTGALLLLPVREERQG